jgi:hypothetical protein
MAVVEGLAQRIVRGDLANILLDVRPYKTRLLAPCDFWLKHRFLKRYFLSFLFETSCMWSVYSGCFSCEVLV